MGSSGRGALYRCLVVLALCAIAVAPVSDLSRSQTGPPAVVDDPTLSDEFVGPFPSWTNVKTAYGAKGDGTSDDTGALQQALSELGAQGHSPVIFLPSGTYRITRTLTLAYTLNVSVVGEDPATTTIGWDGDAGGTMLRLNGVAYSRVTRLTLDGKRRASVAVEQSWDNARPHFDTGNEYADDRFLDVDYGIRGGFKGYGFAETSIIRSQFVRNTVAGIALGNFNALDIWIWHSRFEDCAIGVTNGGTGAGNFHVYSSVFHRSTTADLAMGNTGVFSARGNYSSGSQAFFVSVVSKASPAAIHLQGNTVVDPVGSTPIDLKNQGPGLRSDNVIRIGRASGPAVRWTSLTGADVTSVGNTYTVATPIENNGRLLAVADRIVEPAAVAIAKPVLPGTPPNHRRPIFEVASGAQARDIQNMIDQASRQRGTRPIVHVAHGIYSIAATLTIPASDVQLVGDGYGTILRWTGASAGPLLSIHGPSQATIRELQLDGMGKADGLVVEHVDQVGGRVYLDQVQLRSGKRTDLFVNGLDHATVELRDFGHAYSPSATSVKVLGGPLLSAGQPAAGKTSVFSGASSGNTISYEVSAGARLLLRDLWYESGAGPGFANVHDRATITVDGARIASPPNQTTPAFAVTNLIGRAAIVASHVDDRIVVSGNGSAAQVLALAIFAQQGAAGYVVNDTTPGAQVALVNSRHGAKANRSSATPNLGTADATFIDALLQHTRTTMPGALVPLPPGVTDVRMFRVWVTNGVNNITLTR